MLPQKWGELLLGRAVSFLVLDSRTGAVAVAVATRSKTRNGLLVTVGSGQSVKPLFTMPSVEMMVPSSMCSCASQHIWYMLVVNQTTITTVTARIDRMMP